MKTIWIVLKPTVYSAIEDIVFESSGPRLELQFKGGLTGDEIEAFYTDGALARAHGMQLINGMVR